MKAKQFIWIILPLMLLQSFSTVWLWTIFELNRDYIARNECINRFNEKALSCRGQCILMKKMREHEEKEQKNLETRIIDVVFINNQLNFTFETSVFDEVALSFSFPEMKENYAYRPIFSIFHPPLV
ncbi:hypothetical protein ACR78Z_19365 [Sphingobacterium thalpophilum]|uniref:Uncharacterized protein n=1 Tax=Sphingobacterium thalpophilum TaxID=259 RepID=A0A4U9UJA7_9SPHI|nr:MULTISPECIES: hypothetical protein [Sphingobacterium]MCW8310426.1 hypothetical protein [Sphingobacterium sp. InxBP1]VTR33575.1 Uncharacterised protein [Sphingobacterium thalpophilum]